MDEPRWEQKRWKNIADEAKADFGLSNQRRRRKGSKSISSNNNGFKKYVKQQQKNTH